ncbi:MAG: carbamoyl phosphate synthase small subunit [Clostridioides sp.]|jgi:carbamoyl-phosphate synthase small subunit|nr:carbamoyl phosphate synthase small subunit [Clostridioides sp.]
MKARLILEDGTVFEGKAFGYLQDSVGEVVFNTSMIGYGELLTDPSYYGQIVTMTYPLIGNYGINLDNVESTNIHVKGFIVREKCDFPNNHKCEMDIDTYLKQNKVIGLEGIDTRALTKILRNKGCMKGIITLEHAELEDVKHKLDSYSNHEAVSRVTRKEIEHIKGNGKKVVAMDFGIKNNIVRSFKKRGCDIRIVPASTTAEEVLAMNPDLIFLSNGPGDPEDLVEIIENVKKLIDSKKPIAAICLGHQLLTLALGGETSKLKFGHRGGNHPVKDLEEGRVFISSQNHGYYASKLPKGVIETQVNLNDNTNEGMRHETLPIYSVQYHPEACPGPEDNDYIFDKFLSLIEE